MKMKNCMSILAATALSLILVSCGDTVSDPNSGTETSAASTSGMPAALIAATAPEGAVGVVAARKQAKPGEAITLRGKIGGKSAPISDAAAILVLADEEAITSCNDIPGDECPTPWDYCCEESDAIAASTATIQVRDADGQVMRSSLRGVGGIKELSHLVVSGTVDESSTSEVLIVNADQIHVEKP